MIPTIKQVAKEAGVSVATVSRVLNGEDKVSPATKQHVLEVVKQMGYTPNVLGRNLRTSATRKVLVLAPSLSNQFYASVIRGMETVARKQAYQVLTSSTYSREETERELLSMLYSRSVDGVVLLSSKLSADQLSGIAREKPLVMCCEYTQGAQLSAVTIDNYQAGREAVEYLIKRGHKRIALITNESVYSARQRTQGYLDALTACGLPVKTEFIVPTEYTFQAGVSAAKKLMRIKDPPTAIFAISDELAAGVVKVLNEKGMRPGNDVDVFGFDNTSLAKMITPSLSTVSQPRRQMGEQAMTLLLEKITNKNTGNRLVILPHQLVLRETTRSLREQNIE
ncbi:MAG: LacI family transcriptional regulator [Clostridiales bacterium]|nr:LacI family transcriptional regulator [Clostridiales bacterium]